MNQAHCPTHLMSAGQSLASTQPVSPVEEALIRLESQAAALRDLVCRMTTRLNPVLTPTGAGANNPHNQDPKPLPAPLVSKIDDLTDSLCSSYIDLQEIDRRLAL